MPGQGSVMNQVPPLVLLGLLPACVGPPIISGTPLKRFSSPLLSSLNLPQAGLCH